MYQIDIFDKDGAIVARVTVSSWFNAMVWMVRHRTGKIPSNLGGAVFEPVTWQLTRIKPEPMKQPSVPKSNSQARRLAAQRKRR